MDKNISKTLHLLCSAHSFSSKIFFLSRRSKILSSSGGKPSFSAETGIGKSDRCFLFMNIDENKQLLSSVIDTFINKIDLGFWEMDC
jgi:hypothetical protein